MVERVKVLSPCKVHKPVTGPGPFLFVTLPALTNLKHELLLHASLHRNLLLAIGTIMIQEGKGVEASN